MDFLFVQFHSTIKLIYLKLYLVNYLSTFILPIFIDITIFTKLILFTNINKITISFEPLLTSILFNHLIYV